jgi:hypothetical protein
VPLQHARLAPLEQIPFDFTHNLHA